MKIAIQAWNDFQGKLDKITIPTKGRMAIVLVLAILAILGLFRACSGGAPSDDHEFHIASDNTWYPLQLYDKERNMQAFTNEMLLAIAKQQKIHVKLFVAGPDNLFMGLNNGQFDGVLSSLQPNSTNRELYVFSDPFYKVGPVLIVRETSTAKSLADMEGKIIGIRTGSSVVFNIEQYPEIIIRSYDNALLALMDINRNVIDGVILDALTAYIYTSGLFAKQMKIVGPPLTDIGLRLLTRHSEAELIKHFNAGLKAIKEDGTYDQLVLKWGLFNPELKRN